MRACLVCGSVSFDIHGGLFYCQECGTQAEGLREEEKEEAFGESVSASALIKSAQKPKKLRPEETAIDEPETQWLTCEAFNVILFNQTQSLINLGASSSLMDVILKLWAKFLQKNKVCFPETGDAYIPSLGPLPYARDVRLLCGKEADKARKLAHDSRLKKQKDIKIEKSDIKNSENVDVKESGFLQSIFDLEFDENASQALITQFVAKRKKEKTSRCRNFEVVEHMSLQKTLCFCYLGLLLNQDYILLSDLVRFAKEGHIPYLDTTSCFTSDMQLESADLFILKTAFVPKMVKIVTMAEKLSKFLEIPRIPHIPLLPVVIRLVRDMNLPNGLVPLVNLWLPTQTEYWSVSSKSQARHNLIIYELHAMALIVIALKFLFIFDGSTEQQLSEKMSELNSFLEQPLFVWDDWYSTVCCQLEYSKQNIVQSFKIQEAVDIDSLANYYHSNLKEDWLKNVASKRQHKDQQSEFRHSLRCVLSHIAKRKGFNNTKHVATSFPFTAKCKSLRQTSKRFSDHSLIYSVKEPTSGKPLELLSEIQTLFDGHDETRFVTTDKKNYWFVSCNQLTARTVCDNLPFLTFKWLLNFASELIECEPSILYYEIVQYEKKLFKLK